MTQDMDFRKMADYLEEQIAFDLEASLIDGGISPRNYVVDNRKAIRQFVDKAIDMSGIRTTSEKAYNKAVLDVLKALVEVSIYSSRESNFYNKIVEAIRRLRKDDTQQKEG